jgi:hypothetical protein
VKIADVPTLRPVNTVVVASIENKTTVLSTALAVTARISLKKVDVNGIIVPTMKIAKNAEAAIHGTSVDPRCRCVRRMEKRLAFAALCNPVSTAV